MADGKWADANGIPTEAGGRPACPGWIPAGECVESGWEPSRPGESSGTGAEAGSFRSAFLATSARAGFALSTGDSIFDIKGQVKE